MCMVDSMFHLVINAVRYDNVQVYVMMMLMLMMMMMMMMNKLVRVFVLLKISFLLTKKKTVLLNSRGYIYS